MEGDVGEDEGEGVGASASTMGCRDSGGAIPEGVSASVVGAVGGPASGVADNCAALGAKDDGPTADVPLT